MLDCIDFNKSLFLELKKYLEVLKVSIDTPKVGNIILYKLKTSYIRNIKIKRLKQGKVNKNI